MSPTTDPDVTAWNGEANIAYSINGIQGDMGEETIMDLIWQADGDIIVVLSHPRRGSLSIEFCTSFLTSSLFFKLKGFGKFESLTLNWLKSNKKLESPDSSTIPSLPIF